MKESWFFQDGEVKVPEFRRTEELEHFSDGWPSLCELRTRKWRCAFARIAIFLTLVAVGVTLFGGMIYYTEFVGSFPKNLYFEMVAEQLIAPVFLLLLEGLIAYCAFGKKRIPLWIVVIGWVGAFGMCRSGGELTHGLSHAIFDSCTGYDDFMLGLAASIAIAISSVWLLEFRVLRGRKFVKLKITGNLRKALSLLSILTCWAGVLYLLDVI